MIPKRPVAVQNVKNTTRQKIVQRPYKRKQSPMARKIQTGVQITIRAQGATNLLYKICRIEFRGSIKQVCLALDIYSTV